ncbi:MerR family transcriptional regulator [Actinospica robiniae]|uniref:MerR family transcriptional regulator n=1 Tax=Actinospica robiniae TaxID=304901 RepID=UPI00041DBA4D|nr:MerR family transcriptional regulator [Actinospica robiniae]
MAWSITEVAKFSGLTSRTLRHYDEIGLLPPAFVGANGYRHYGEDELLRLQRIMVLRELGLPLPRIAEVLDAQTDRVEALREHLRMLLAERDRLSRLAATVARTIGELEDETGGRAVGIQRPENLFEGFDDTQYADEARERWPAQFARSQAYAATLSEQDKQEMGRENTAAMIRMAELMAAGTPVEDPAVLDETDRHYRFIARFWTPDAAAYKCLGLMYVDDERFTATYDRIAVGLAAYYRDAMAAYADARLD